MQRPLVGPAAASDASASSGWSTRRAGTFRRQLFKRQGIQRFFLAVTLLANGYLVVFAFQLSRDIGRYAPRARMVEVFVNTTGGTINGPVPSGHYRGVYVLSKASSAARTASISNASPLSTHNRPRSPAGIC